MGHLHDQKAVYQQLGRRVDKTQTGLPETPETLEILKHLFSPEDAELAIRLPLTPRPLGSIAKRTGLAPDVLREKLQKMADKGLVFDFNHPKLGDCYVLAPPIVGFFEFSLMRVRSDIDQKAVAKLLATYLYERPNFAFEIERSMTPVGRTLVHEDAIDTDLSSEVLDYESAKAIIEDANGGAVSICYCRHKKEHLGHPCSKTLELCLSLNRGADFTVRHGFARAISKQECLEILAKGRDEGLAQIADNVRNEVGYICNCCGCCCGQLAAVNRHGFTHAVATSNFMARIERSKCTGCGKCMRVCPIQAISLRPKAPHEQAASKHKFAAQVEEEICLGCGVCHVKCAASALHMEKRPKRVLTPDNTVARALGMALGRGKLHDFLFDEEGDMTSAFLHRVVGAIERMPATRRAVMNNALRSRFVDFVGKLAIR